MASSNDVVVRATLQDDLSRPLDEVRVKVRAVGSETETAGRKASLASRGFTSLKTAGAGLAGILGRAGALGAAGLGAGLAAAGTVGIKTASQMEQAKISFTTMLGSAQKAGAFLEQLKTFAAKTPFEMTGLQEASSSLISAGVDASKVIPIMTTLGDVTSGMGTGSEGIKRATVALQQMNAAQRITGEDLNQLRDAGIPVYDLLAASIGKSKGEVVALAQSGKLGKKELDALMKGLESGKGLEKFKGLMEAQSQSLEGMWSTLKDTFSQGMSDLITPNLPLLKAGVQGLTDAVGIGVEWAKANLPAFQAAVSQAISGATAALQGADIPGIWAQIQGAFSGGGTGQATAMLTNLATIAAGSVGPAIDGVKIIVDGAGTAFDFLAQHMGVVQAVLPGLIASFAAYKTLMAVNNVLGRDSAIGLGLQLAANLTLAASNRQLAASYASVAAAQGTSTAASNVGLLTRIRETAATVAGKVAQLGMAAAQKIAAAGQWALNVAMSANPIGIVIALIAALVAGLVWFFTQTKVGQQAWAAFTSFLSTAWNVTVAALSAGVSAVVGFFQGLPGRIIGAVMNFANTVKTGVMMVIGFYVSFYSRVFGILGQFATAVAMKAGLAALWLWQKIKGGIDTAVGFVASLPGRAASALGSLASTLAGAASSAVDGFLGFFRDLPGKIGDALAGAFRTAQEWAGKIADVGRGAVNAVTGGAMGDTLVSRASSGSSWVGALPHMTSGQRISNIAVGGGGLGRGSGDHQAGRAVDVVGPNLHGLIRSVQGAGGYGAIHGSGATRHAHLVPAGPMGDTATSRVRLVSPPSAAGDGRRSVTISGVNVTVNHHGPAGADFDRAVQQAVSRGIRDAMERA